MWNKPITRGQILYESWGSYSCQILQDGKWSGGCQELEEENVKSACNGYGASVVEEEKVLEVGGSNASTTIWMYLMPQNCTLKNGLNGKF